jgi:UDP-3-O-acyl-N-acetylglucosamine deacetylase
MMGEQGYFRDSIRQIMQSTDAKTFRAEFKRARDAGLAPDVESFKNIHLYLDTGLRSAMRMAESNLANRDGIQRKVYQNEVVENMLQVGDIDGAKKFLDDMKQTMSY